MVDVEALYYSTQFQNMIAILARKKSISDLDDFRHDVFVEILSCGAESKAECKRAAWRVAYQYERDDDIEAEHYGGILPA